MAHLGCGGCWRHPPRMAGDGDIGLDQLFQQGMAKHVDAHLCPLLALLHKQALPVARAQGLPHTIGGLQQECVFVEHGERVAQSATLLTHTLARNVLRLQLVQAAFAAAKAQPTQAIEKVMQVVAGRDALLSMDEGLIGLALGQFALRHKAQVGAPQALCSLVERVGHAVPRHHRRAHRLAQRSPRRKPRRLPVNGLPCGRLGQVCMRHASVSPPHKGLMAASPKGKVSGTVQVWRAKVMRPVLRGRP